MSDKPAHHEGRCDHGTWIACVPCREILEQQRRERDKEYRRGYSNGYADGLRNAKGLPVAGEIEPCPMCGRPFDSPECRMRQYLTEPAL